MKKNTFKSHEQLHKTLISNIKYFNTSSGTEYTITKEKRSEIVKYFNENKEDQNYGLLNLQLDFDRILKQLTVKLSKKVQSGKITFGSVFEEAQGLADPIQEAIGIGDD